MLKWWICIKMKYENRESVDSNFHEWFSSQAFCDMSEILYTTVHKLLSPNTSFKSHAYGYGKNKQSGNILKVFSFTPL